MIVKKISFLLAVVIILSLVGCGSVNSTTQNLISVEDKDITLEFSFGERTGKFTGTLENGLPVGEGTFTTINTDGTAWTYTGEWVNGHFDGFGATEWKSDPVVKYEGDYRNDERTGVGKWYEADSLIYEGEVNKGIYNGTGTLYKNGKISFSGTFANGFPDYEEYRNSCKSISYDNLARNPDLYIGTPLIFFGTIIQVFENTEQKGSVVYRVEMAGKYDDIIAAHYTRSENESRLLDGDKVKIMGFYNGLLSYESNFSVPVTIPDVDAIYIDRIS